MLCEPRGEYNHLHSILVIVRFAITLRWHHSIIDIKLHRNSLVNYTRIFYKLQLILAFSDILSLQQTERYVLSQTYNL